MPGSTEIQDLLVDGKPAGLDVCRNSVTEVRGLELMRLGRWLAAQMP